MRTGNCNFRAFAAAVSFVAALGGLTTSLPASAASITYTDPICSQFYTVPGLAPGDVLLRCVAMSCSVTTSTSYIVPVSTNVTLTASCTTAVTGFTWTVAPISPQGCPVPSSTTGASVQVASSSAMTCWYDVVANDAPNGNQGISRYGIVWTSVPAGCAATASPTSLASSSGPVSLGVTCAAGNPLTTASWTRDGVSISLNALSGSDTPPANSTASPQTHTYAVTPCNSAGCATSSFAAPTVTVAGVALLPSGCSISTAPSPPSLSSIGGNIGMTVSCTGGAPFTQFNWRKNSANFGSNAATQSDSLPANTGVAPVSYAYDVQVCNAAGCATRVSTTFTVAGQQVSSGLCGQYNDVLQVDLPTGNPDQLITQSSGGFMADGVFVGRFVASSSSMLSDGQLNWAEYQDGAPANRAGTVSTQACDFRGTYPSFTTDPTGVSAPLKWVFTGPAQGQILYTIAPDLANGEPQLIPGQTYYLNIRNMDFFGNITCGTATCNMIVQHVLPH